MQLATLTYDRQSGWSKRPSPELDSPNTLVLVFGASSFADDPAPFEELAGAYPLAQIVGCSTSGEILGKELHDDSLVVAIARFEGTRLVSTSAPVADAAASFGAGRLLADRLRQDDLRSILVLSDGLSVNGSELVRGFNSALPDTVVLTGGLAGDGDRFARTWVVGDRRPCAGIVSAIGFYGDRVHVGHGSMGGWDRFGPERRITRSRGNVLFELDGKPALQLYKQYLGERSRQLPAAALLFPLAVRATADDTRHLVRTVLSIDEATQSMTFAGDMPEGHLAQLMRAESDRLIEGASAAAGASRRTGDGAAATLAVAISCVGRRLVLGERTEEEIEATLAALPRRTQQVGFYSYGEISPPAMGYSDLHNQTMTLTTLSED